MLKRLLGRLGRTRAISTPKHTIVLRGNPYVAGVGSLLDITGSDRGSFLLVDRRPRRRPKDPVAEAWGALGQDWQRVLGWPSDPE